MIVKGDEKMTNHTLKQMILNEIESHPRGYAEELATISGTYSNGSNLKKVLNDPKKEFEKFQGLINIVEFIWKSDSIEIMVEYSKEVDVNKKTARNFLEYLATNRKFEAFNSLVERMATSTNKESLEWAKIYKFQYQYELSKTIEDYQSLVKEINQTQINTFELNVYKKMLMNYCFNQLSDYGMLKMLSVEIENDVELIENEYIKERYTIRSSEIMAYYYLKIANNPEAARKCADKIISSNAKPAFKAYAYFIKGYSYLFTSYDKAILYLTQSKEIYISLNRQFEIDDLTRKLKFVNAYWGKTEWEEYTTGIELNVEYQLYFDGCNSKDNKKLMVSLIKFVKNNDLFLANLPKIELLRNGYDEEILDELTK
jgi:hypothetical protein